MTLNRRNFVAGTAAALPLASAIKGNAAKGKKKKIKIGQIGTGHAHAGGVFASLLRVQDDYEVVGVVENNPQLRKKIGDKYQGVKVISEEQLLNTKGLQAVVVETEVYDLLPTAERCINAGMHIHLDKPPGETVDRYKKLLVNASRKKLDVQMGYIYRYSEPFQFLFKAVKEGWLGHIFEVHATMSKKVSDASRKKLAKYKGGSMFEIGCHVIDAAVKVLGKPKKITPFIRHTHPEKDGLADNQLAVFEYPKATASIRSSLIEFDGFRRRQFTVVGESGTIDIRPLGGQSFRMTLERPQGKYKKGYQNVTLPVTRRGFDPDFRDLAAIIRGEKKTDFSKEHDLAVHESVLIGSGYKV